MAVFQMTSLVASLTAEMEMVNRQAPPEISSFDPAKMLHDLVGYYKKIGLTVRFNEHIDDLPDRVTGDPKLLKCAFSNLISNAIKYSPEGSRIEISGKTDDGVIAIGIADHGIGIPQNELNRIGERFYRASNTGSIPGTGVGLSLVQQIVEEHGGKISIASAQGEGTRIVVLLPIGNPAETRTMIHA